ncbi:MAG TPA: WecB/TagA/CpsF family glycosyltransferase [Acidisarcina sp.]
MRARLGRIAILGVPIDNLSMDETVEEIDRLIVAGGFHQVATANVDFLMNSIDDDELMDILHRCELVLADGMPLVWASRAMGTPLKGRIAGADLLPRLLELSQSNKRRIFLLGATEERSQAAAAWIRSAYPGAELAGRYSPPFAPLEEMDHAHILKLIEEADADILLVAFGNPKQEKWLAMHRSKLQVPVCIGVGASIDFLSGSYRRAPGWMQQHGLEWLHRFSQEPKRLAGRYARNAFGIAVHLSMQMLAVSSQSRSAEGSRLVVVQENRALIVRVVGRFTGKLLEEFQQSLQRSLRAHCALVMDMNLTTYVGADGLGTLLDLRGRLHDAGQEVWMVGMRSGLRRLFRTAFLDRRLFQFAPRVADALRRIDSMAPNSVPASMLHRFYKE